MTSLGITPLLQNQLQFSLNVPPSMANFASHRGRPGPILMEKLGIPPTSPKPVDNPLRFSTISEEDMDVAVRLARRDLKKKRLEVEMEQYMQKMAERASPKIDKKEEERRKARERLGIGIQTPRAAKQTQTRKPGKGKVLKPRTHNVGREEVRPHSPPTRDTDILASKLSQDERTALEIRRLRMDLRNYIDEINRLDVVARRPEPSNLHEDITDEEYYSKRKARVLGRATRSSRMVYDLKQQVRAIYDEIKYMRPDEEPRKKSDVIKRLAAVHRATVRALQDLVHQLPEAGHDDVGKISHDLGALIQQLTECCQQMEIADHRDGKDPNVEKLISKNPVAASVWKEVAQGPIEFSQKLCRPYQPEVPQRAEETWASDERTKALRAGLENLLKARSPPKQRPAVIVPFEYKPEVAQAQSKGVLLSRPKNKAKKAKNVQKPQKNSLINEKSERPHYTEETLAHRRKVRDPVQREASRSRSRSPKAPSPRIVATDRVEKLNLGVPNEWIDQAETAIKQRLEPLLKQAKRLNAAQQSPSSMRQLLSVKALDRIECNSGLLVDLILEDLLKDTACELVNLETEEKIENDANILVHGSELHTMLDRLELIEREQIEIRDRWNSVRYNDVVEVPRIPLSETPRSPEPTTVRGEAAFPPEGIVSHPPRAALEKSPIIFTNEPTSARLRSEKLDMLRTQALKNEMGFVEVPRRYPTLTEDDVHNIHEYRNLKLITKYKTEKSWRLVEQLADDIMQDLLDSAAEEMMRTSSELDNQICMQELALGQNVHLSTTDTEILADDNQTIDERFPINFDEDSCMDLHDMIHDDVNYSHATNISGYHADDDNEVERIVADARQRSYHVNDGVLETGHEAVAMEKQTEVSYHDDRRQAEDLRLELDQFDVGNLETVVRENGEHDVESEEAEEVDELSEEESGEEESRDDRRVALHDDVNDLQPTTAIMGNDVDDLQPISANRNYGAFQPVIRSSQETEERTDDIEGEVEYSSEFLTTTAEDLTGPDSAR